jgi:hypothetical protein
LTAEAPGTDAAYALAVAAGKGVALNDPGFRIVDAKVAAVL